MSGRIQNRQDVVAALDMISEYYRRNEPASPMPLMVLRMREWVNMDFLSMLREIAPSSLDEVNKILLSREQQEAGSGY